MPGSVAEKSTAVAVVVVAAAATVVVAAVVVLGEFVDVCCGCGCDGGG